MNVFSIFTSKEIEYAKDLTRRFRLSPDRIVYKLLDIPAGSHMIGTKTLYDLFTPDTSYIEYLEFVYQEFLSKKSILLTEDELALRLMVSKNSPDWPKLKNRFKSTKYTGIGTSTKNKARRFYRWWKPLVFSFFRDRFKEHLIDCTPKEAISLYRKSFKLKNLVPLPGDSTWYELCEYCGDVVDFTHAFALRYGSHMYSWQRNKYICYKCLSEKPYPTIRAWLRDDSFLQFKNLKSYHRKQVRKEVV